MTASEAEIRTKEARVDAARFDLKIAASKIKVGERDVGRLTTLVGFATIKAPFDGVITKRWVDTGTIIKENAQPLFTVMRTDKVRVLLDIPEKDVQFIKTSANPQEVLESNTVAMKFP